MQRISTLALLFFTLLFSCSAMSAAPSTANLRFSPLALAVGAVNVEADIAINRYYSISPMYTQWDFDVRSDFNLNAMGYGLRVDYHTKRVLREGVFYGAFIKHWDVSVKYLDNDEEINSDVTVETVGGLMGYRWMWSSFNINAEIGYRLMVFNGFDFTIESGKDNKVNITDINTMGGTFADLSVGWAF